LIIIISRIKEIKTYKLELFAANKNLVPDRVTKLVSKPLASATALKLHDFFGTLSWTFNHLITALKGKLSLNCQLAF